MTIGPRLAVFFSGLVGVMTFHELEHVVQVLQKDALGATCPNDCRGLLGFAFDVEWIHFTYNVSIELGLVAVAVALRVWKARPTAAWALLCAAVALQGYHVVEHSEKLAQWFANGRHSPTPGVLGHHVSLVELHFGLNTVVFVLAAGAFLGYRVAGRLAALATPARVGAVGLAAALLVAGTGAMWMQRPPTVRLAGGVHEGPIVVDRAQRLVGEPGAVVRGGIVVTADDVIVRDLAVIADEHGIEVQNATDVVLERVVVTGVRLDGIHARRSSLRVEDCEVHLSAPYAQGIDISFAFDLPGSRVEGCRVTGGQEGIVSHMAHVDVHDNHVQRTSLRGIAVTEMSMGTVRRNAVESAVGVGIYCGDFSHCAVHDNTVRGTVPDPASSDATRAGHALQAHFGAIATVAGNVLVDNANDMAAFAEGEIRRAER